MDNVLVAALVSVVVTYAVWGTCLVVLLWRKIGPLDRWWMVVPILLLWPVVLDKIMEKLGE